MTDPDSSPVRLSELLPGVGSTIPGPFDTNTDRESLATLSGQRTPGRLKFARRIEGSETPSGYGTDPNMITPRSPWPKTLTLYERRTIAVLSDIMLPAGPENAAPSEVGIVDFFDDWLSAPYAGQIADKTQIRAGLMRLDDIAQSLFRQDFIPLSNADKHFVIDRLIGNAGDDLSFFLRFRYLVVGGYFTSDVGMRIIGYRGNVPLRKPAQVSPEGRDVIERELQKLGL